jgi:hypothetical protein
VFFIAIVTAAIVTRHPHPERFAQLTPAGQTICPVVIQQSGEPDDHRTIRCPR